MGRLESFKTPLRLASAGVGAALFALSCAGFDHVSKSRSAFGDQTTFGCICFLGACFGILLALAELNWGLFYFFFGFLRYRIGRAIMFVVAGIMIGLIGKNLDRQCGCDSYAILIAEGIACVGMAAVHVVAIFAFGNNTKPVVLPNTGTAGSGAAYQSTHTTGSATLEPVSETPVPQPAPRSNTSSPGAGTGDPNMPAWMNA